MIIKSNIYHEILNMPAVPPETGGIIGMQNDIVTSFVFDKGKTNYQKAMYTPNIYFINNQINKWRNYNIIFCGIVHTHPSNQNFLSKDDINYIKKIINSMPETIPYLYFPIIIPQKKMLSYIAKSNKCKVEIYADEIIVIK